MTGVQTSRQSRTTSRAEWEVVILGQGFVFLLLILFFLSYSVLTLWPENLIYPASILMVILFAWSLWSWKKVTKSLFDPYVLFLTAAVLFNGGHALLEVFRLNKDGILGSSIAPNVGFEPETILATLSLVLIGLAAFHSGALVSVATNKGRRSERSDARARGKPKAEHIRVVGWGLLFISFLPALVQLRDAVAVVMSSGYFALFQRQIRTGFGATFRVIAAFLVPAAFFLLAGSKKRRSGIIVSGLVVCGYSLLQFFLGSRSMAVMPLVAYAWLWHRHIRRIPGTILVVAGAVMLFVVFPLIQAVRNVSGSERLAFSFLIDSFFSIDNPAVRIISDMGTAMKTVAFTLELVPRIRPFDLGLGYGYAFLAVIPNLFWGIHPTAAHGLAADWLVWAVAPGYAALGGGFGFSFIAEAYLNFGWLGIAPVLGLVGFLFGKLVMWAQGTNEPVKLATAASFLAFFLLYARGEAGLVVRPLIWYALLPYILVHVVSRLKKPHARSKQEHMATTEV